MNETKTIRANETVVLKKSKIVIEYTTEIIRKSMQFLPSAFTCFPLDECTAILYSIL